MKTIIDCDHVFIALTAKPFSLNSDTDRPIIEHLAQCDACRQLARAIRPACDLLNEQLPDARQESPPMCLDAEERALDTNLAAVMRSIAPPSVEVPSVTQKDVAWRVTLLSQPALLAICVGLLCMLLVKGNWSRDPRSSVISPSLQSLDGIQLGHFCVAEAPRATVAEAGMTPESAKKHECCTKCHHFERPQNRGPAVPALLASCSVCHH